MEWKKGTQEGDYLGYDDDDLVVLHEPLPGDEGLLVVSPPPPQHFQSSRVDCVYCNVKLDPSNYTGLCPTCFDHTIINFVDNAISRHLPTRAQFTMSLRDRCREPEFRENIIRLNLLDMIKPLATYHPVINPNMRVVDAAREIIALFQS